MRKCLLFLLCLCFLSSCAHERRRRADYETFVGINEKELVNIVGVPDSVYEMDDERFLTYFKTGSSYAGYGQSFPQFCKITFVFYKGSLDNWRYEGNMCDSYIESIDLH